MKKNLTGILIMVCLATHVFAQPNTKKTPPPKTPAEAAGRFCLANFATYDDIKNWINTNKKSKPDIPVPPAGDPDCHDCKEMNKTDENQKKIDNWIEKTLVQPEKVKITQLLQMSREWQLIQGDAKGKIDGYPDCFYKFSPAEFDEMISFLINRVYDRTIRMAEKYKSEDKYAIAGIQSLLSVGREYLLVMGDKANDKGFMSLAQEWAQNYYNKVEDRLFKQYQYQLFPNMLSFEREIQLLGGEADKMHDDIEKWINKIISFMHFKLTIKFDAEGDDAKGSEFFAHMQGQTELRCRKTTDNCFVWEPVNGGTMEFKIDGIKTKTPQGVATYQSPQKFSTPVQITVNMCDHNPEFRIVFDRLAPATEYYSVQGGGTQSLPVLSTLVLATLGSVNADKMKEDGAKMQADMQKLMGSEADIKAFTDRVNAHKNDSSYFLNTAQGRQDAQKLQALKSRFGEVSQQDQDRMTAMKETTQAMQEKMKRPGYMNSKEYYADQEKIKQGTDAAQDVMKKNLGGAFNLLKIDLPFMIGNKIAVNGTIHDKVKEKSKGEGNGVWQDAYFVVTLENTSQ